MADPIYVRAPSHLGDGVLALPAVRALAELGPLHIDGPAWAPLLYRHLLPARPPAARARVAVLLKPSFSAAWRALLRRHPRRIGLSTDLRGPLLTTRVRPGGGHRQADLDAVARAAGAVPQGAPRFPLVGADFAAAPDLRPGTVLLLPGSGSGDSVEWQGYRALADALRAAGRPVAFAGGPAERDRWPRLAGDHPVLPELSIGPFGAAAVRASAVVGNDSGLTHLATAARRAAGVDTASVHVVCGGTDPARTAAPGATPWTVDPAPACWPCYRKTCRQRHECLATPVDAVLAALMT
jgi:ADP-heptose:LPS heptosyltransferase